MLKLRIVRKEGIRYELESEDADKYILYINFYDIEPLPHENEYIYLSKNLLDTEYTDEELHLSFGDLKSLYGRKIDLDRIIENKDEILILDRRSKKIYLKRFYG